VLGTYANENPIDARARLGSESITMVATDPGNPPGRPRGSRNRATLNEEFIAALLRNFRREGERAIARVAGAQPAAYLKLVASLVPREHRIEQTDLISSMSDEDLRDTIQLLKEYLAAVPAELIDQTPVVDIPDRSSQQMVEIARAVRIPPRSRQPKADIV
jgi:hypothetical protein